VAKLREVIGAGPDDKVQIVTPQFERSKGEPAPAPPPPDRDAWEALRTKSREALHALGLRAWAPPDVHGRVLMLLPGKWYTHIPKGYAVVSINGGDEPFEPGVTDDDIRFGCLAYGLRVRVRP